VLAADGGGGKSYVATLLPGRLLGLVGLRLVLEFVLLLGLGAVPLRPLVLVSALRMGLVSRPGLGAGVGVLAAGARLLRLGAPATGSTLQHRDGLDV